MEEKLAQLHSKLEADQALAEKLFSLDTPEEVQSLLKEQGIDFTIEEIEVMREALVKIVAKGDASELTDEDLEDVAGGFVGTSTLLIGTLVTVGSLVGGFVTDAIRRRR
jgi:predicted ribosomally synthesized peptide with nif11-like leader